VYSIFIIELNLYIYLSWIVSLLKFWLLQIPPSRMIDPSEVAQFLPLTTSRYEKLTLPSTKLATGNTTAVIWTCFM